MKLNYLSEGEITKARSFIVDRKNELAVAIKIGLEKLGFSKVVTKAASTDVDPSQVLVDFEDYYAIVAVDAEDDFDLNVTTKRSDSELVNEKYRSIDEVIEAFEGLKSKAIKTDERRQDV
jgi:hypothetical protein